LFLTHSDGRRLQFGEARADRPWAARSLVSYEYHPLAEGGRHDDIPLSRAHRDERPSTSRLGGLGRTLWAAGEISRKAVFLGESTDRGGKSLHCEWIINREVGNCPQDAMLETSDSPLARLTSPHDSESAEIHVIVAVRNEGEPALASYGRIVVSVKR